MRGSRFSTCLALALLTLVCAAPSASAKCVYALVKAFQSYHGAFCPPEKYTTINGKVLITKACSCTACDGQFPYCVPLYLIKSP
jgi:hypothetical protein